MPDQQPALKKGFSADWLMRGVLTRIGDTFDRLTGRRWIPSSSLATSGLIERLKLLMDSEARNIPGKGTVVPHNIKLKMQWDKFSTDGDDALARLENELLAAAADHINDSLYYTYAPLKIEVKRDYFTEGVKLFVSYDTFVDEEKQAELNVTIAGLVIPTEVVLNDSVPAVPDRAFIARFEINGVAAEKRLVLPLGGRLPIGRVGTGGFVLNDPSVSKIHASLAINAAGVLCVADTGSTNGTFVNNERISYGRAVEIPEGDVVKFGLVGVRFEPVALDAEIESVDEIRVMPHVDDPSATSAAKAPATSPASGALASDTIEVVPPDTPLGDANQNSGSPAKGNGNGEIPNGESNQ